ncbi:MAG: ABC transporter ATP-binding protein [SAR202 cluster bacterium]|nr:MAG: ABC transporter ATP-binding protein [SAR202 cluster bacterium]
MYFDLRLWALTRGFRLRIAFAVLYGILTAAAGIARLVLLGVLLGEILKGERLEDLLMLILGAGGMVLLRAILQYHKEMVAHRTAASIQLSMRESLQDQVIALGPAYFAQQRTGDAMLSIVDGVEQLETFFGQYLPQLFTAILTPIGIFFYLMYLDLPMALIALGFSILTIFAPAAFHRWNKNASIYRREAYGDFAAEFLDAVQGLFTLKSFGQSNAKANVLAEKAHAVFKSTMWVLATNAGSLGVTIAGVAIGAAIMLVVGANRVDSGEMRFEELLIILMLGIELFRPFRELSQLFHQGLNGLSAAHGVFSFLDTNPSVTDNQSDGVEPETTGISFEDVSFSYPGSRQPALKNFDLEVLPGQTAAIVGESGAGKSSVIRLLLRFFDVNNGSVLISDKPVNSLTRERLSSLLAVVSQDTYLFHGTVAENLRFGNQSASLKDLEKAAELANATEFINRLPNGYETLIGERGIKLSGGQRQRIAIARALLKDAPVLVLDEALSAVDSENEHVIQAALDRLMKGRTVLVIAHRLSSVKNADQIHVMRTGTVVESGSHDELLNKNGEYARLMAAQEAAESESTNHQLSGIEKKAEVTPVRTSQIDDRVNMEPTDAILRAEGMGWLQTFGVLMGLIRPWWKELSLSFFLGLARFATLIGVGITSGLIVAAVRSGDPRENLVIILLAIAPITAILHWAESWVSHDVAFRLLSEMRISLFRKLDQLAPAYLVRRRTGDLVSMATQDVETVEYFFAHIVAPAFVAVAVPAAVLVTLGIYGWPLAMVAAPFLILTAISPLVARDRVDRLGGRSREKLGEMNSHSVDTVQGLHEVSAYNMGEHRRNEFMRMAQEYVDVRIPFFRELTLQKIYLELITGLGGLAVAIVGAYLVSQGSLDAGLLPLLTIVTMSAFLPISEISTVGRLLADTIGSTRRIYAVQLEPILVSDGDERDLVDTEINLEDVGFSYDFTDFKALDQVEFSITQGDTVALVGPSGAGKTTAAHLIMRFWDPQSGAVSLGGKDLRNYVLSKLRESLALVAQDTYLFNTSLRENFLIANPSATDDEVTTAVAMAGLSDFIETLPEGLDTVVGERGSQLSGGQRQRVSIGRAFLKDAPILVLDEATSHLDAVNEYAVRTALDKLASGRTTLVIAHRLSTVMTADLIVVMNQGQVVEYGTHEELLERGGLYTRLVSRQLTTARSKG